MNEILMVVIPGDPVPQGRPRFAVNKKTGKVIVYDPKECKAWKRMAGYVMFQAAKEDDFTMATGPVRVFIVAMFQAPKSKRKDAPVEHHIKRNGDIDNIVKAVLDAGNGVLWKDDALVCQLEAHKSVAMRDVEPQVSVIVRKLEEGE
jgi:Holliday junction resolvase RusA-like endonuclease